jgi:hypothetical protein
VNRRLEAIITRSFKEVVTLADKHKGEHPDRRLHAGDRPGGDDAPARGMYA